jgi:hypothetical protein
LTRNWYNAEQKKFKVAFSLKLKKGLLIVILAPPLCCPCWENKVGEWSAVSYSEVLKYFRNYNFFKIEEKGVKSP